MTTSSAGDPVTNFSDPSLVSGLTPFSSTESNSESEQATQAKSEIENGIQSQISPAERQDFEQHHEHVEKHKFVGRSREREDILKSMSPRKPIEPTADVIRWTEILGLDSSTFTAEDVHRAWRKQISSDGVHPDLGGELEAAILLNIAKDSLTKYLDSFAPKLGKQFLHLK